MKQTDSNYLNMVGSVLANLTKDQADWSDEPEIVTEVDAITVEYTRIKEDLVLVSGLDSRGHTITKTITFDTIIHSTYKLCRKMCVYARRKNDPILFQLVNYSEDALRAGMEKKALSRCSAIVKKAESMTGVLAPFKITLDELSGIHNLMTAFNQQVDDRSTVKTSKLISVKDISAQIRSLKDRFAILDDMIIGFIENEEMVDRYLASRIVINYGKGKTAKKVAEPVPAG